MKSKHQDKAAAYEGSLYNEWYNTPNQVQTHVKITNEADTPTSS